MKKLAFILFTVILTFNVTGQTINVSEKLTLLHVTDKVNLNEKSATLEGDNIEIEKIKETIAALGYKPE